MNKIDINCDLGEGMQTDELIMPYITSANIACGYHAGNENLIKKTINLCKKYNVNIGAHPSFFDKENFGRTMMQLLDFDLYNLITEQLTLFNEICTMQNIEMQHVKLHGALYNLAAKDKNTAKIVAKAVFDFNSKLLYFGLSGSVMIDEAEKIGLKTMSEVFSDRTYQDDGSLTPRTEKNALITNEIDAVNQVMMMVHEGKVISTNQKEIPIKADTVCIHGDGIHSVQFAKTLHQKLFNL